MKIKSLQIQNIKSFKNVHNIEFSSRINIFIGRNNSGKSTILNSLYNLQKRQIGVKDITLGEKNGSISLKIDSSSLPPMSTHKNLTLYRLMLGRSPNSHDEHLLDYSANVIHEPLPQNEPDNIIYPYLSKRKVSVFDSRISMSEANSVTGNLSYLTAKIDRINNFFRQPYQSNYSQHCKDVLGFEIGAVPNENGDGKTIALTIDKDDVINISEMGEGVSNALGLIVDLNSAENKVFVIEELENDMHPQALKALLKLIAEKSITNQFFISTHSNIVMKHLGTVNEAKVFNVINEKFDEHFSKMALSEVKEISTSEERRKVLEDLGYDLWDYDLWKGWLFLEESSAEVIIREYLIKWFAGGLIGKLRTFSSNGFTSMKDKIEDFSKLFVFIGLEPAYKNKVWVILDEGEEKQKVINQLKETYSKQGWKKENFFQFAEHDFEHYYPDIFQADVEEIKNITGNRKERRQEQRIKKEVLLKKVKNWIATDEQNAKDTFKQSASEVILLLQKIESTLST